MASAVNGYDQDLEDRILRIVSKIKSNRNRPCYQNIHAMLSRGGKEISADDLKVFLNNLVDNGLLENKGGIDRESFSLANESFDRPENDILVTDNTSNTSSLQDFIDGKFYEIILNRINDEVKKSVKSEMESYANNINVIKSSNELSKDKKAYDQLFAENKHLRAQLKCKDETIEMLRKLSNVFESSNKSIKLTNRSESNVVKIDESKKLNRDNKKKKINQHEVDKFANVTVRRKRVNTDVNKRNITILGDSIVKDIKPFKMKKMLSTNDKLYVKSFPGAGTSDMADYIKPTLRRNPDIIVYHAGTNNLRGDDDPENIANEIINLALDIKTEVNKVIVSSLLVREDNLNEKALSVNQFLKTKCSQEALDFIDNSNITKVHLNRGGLHLNFKGTIALAKNVMGYINN